ncbi:Type I secretion system membrane fusion protein PrsE [Sinobacterium norvegicum]|uniref:Membrane fusion protein (MFP) family protein n=1 Tax=Sinobacterium norvegicum TaxID=1641715 RepID=A0ABN8EE77_9GAMM|nr:HlyD family type I secretion periplasmic adaptor subunit [Sinobacterium norvegicum]CAH0990289.1 Type I secretion system membrane fusion protein PrsE [Sinobacterium norvegicum]
MSSQLHWQQIKRAYLARKVVWLIFGLVICIIIWASFSKLDEVVIGQGKVVPSNSVQQIQSYEGGIVEQILVNGGEVVSQGQILVILDDTRFRSSFQEAEQQRISLQVKKERLKAELESVIVGSYNTTWRNIISVKHQNLQTEIEDRDAVYQAQASYNERLRQLQAQLQLGGQRIEQQEEALSENRSMIATLEQSLALNQKELEWVTEALNTGAIAEIELLKLQREDVRIQGDIKTALLVTRKLTAAKAQAIIERRNYALDFRTRAQIELDDIRSQLARLAETQTAVAEQLARTTIRSPIDGTVKNITIRSLGGVLKPGESIMEVVPADDNLIIEAKLSPKDIAFVKKGLSSIVKFSAYDFVIYGGLIGRVEYISADALQDEEGQPYYRAHILTESNRLNGYPIIPGMQADVNILTGKKTVMSYWLKPLLRARADALREQ